MWTGLGAKYLSRPFLAKLFETTHATTTLSDQPFFMPKTVASAPKHTGTAFKKDAPRSEHDPDLEAATANLAIHPVTGTFADPALESAFAAQLFRLAFPLHVLLLALCLAMVSFMVLDVVPALKPLWIAIGLVGMFGLVSAAATHPPTPARPQHAAARDHPRRESSAMPRSRHPHPNLHPYPNPNPNPNQVGRVLLHQMHDVVRGQRMGSWTWTIMFLTVTIADSSASLLAPTAICVPTQDKFLPLMLLIATAIVNGSHGMGFAHKGLMVVVLLIDFLLLIAVCGDNALSVALSQTGAVVVAAAVAHVAELNMRQSFAEREALLEQNMQTRQLEHKLEVRVEQLQAEKERLMYDVQRRGRLLNDDERSTIRRGLQAGRSRPHHPASNTDPSDDPSDDSQPPSLPPGAPSSPADSSSIAPPPVVLELQRLAAGALPASTPVSEAGSISEVSEAVLMELVGDEEAMLELQSILSSLPDNPENVAALIAHRVQEAVDSTPQGQEGKRQRQEPYLSLVSSLACGASGAGVSQEPPGRTTWKMSDDGMTPRQQALHVARECMRIRRTDVEIYQVVRQLAVALGANRTEGGTIKALHAVLLQLDRPGMNDIEAYTSTGASMSNFKKWRRRVLNAQLGASF